MKPRAEHRLIWLYQEIKMRELGIFPYQFYDYQFITNIIKGLYLWESGPSLGDPISYNYDFNIDGTTIKFKEFINKEFWPEIEKNRNAIGAKILNLNGFKIFMI